VAAVVDRTALNERAPVDDAVLSLTLPLAQQLLVAIQQYDGPGGLESVVTLETYVSIVTTTSPRPN
jgi:hypothetical protein